METLEEFSRLASNEQHLQDLTKRSLKICIATPDILGPVRNGGIGTAYGHLASLLAKAGHDVTILYTLGDFCENKSIAHWQKYYERRGITFLSAVRQGPPSVSGFLCDVMLPARNTYENLKNLPSFDVMHAPEYGGHLHYVLQAKRQGLAFQNTVICITTHAPTLWALEGNAQPVSNKFELAKIALERTCVSLADILVSPSNHMIEWLQSHHFPLPSQVYVQQNIMPVDDDWAPSPPDRRQIRELVFFGRLEKRKGLNIFIKALERLTEKGCLEGISITFMGKMTAGGSSQIASFRKKVARRINVVSDMDAKQALGYLAERRDRLAVIPSLLDNSPYTVLECLVQATPFLSSNVGGIPELIHPDDSEAVTFRPYAKFLYEKLKNVLEEGIAPARLAQDPIKNRQTWLDFHEALARGSKRFAVFPPAEENSPLVSVCIIHFNRAEKVTAAIESIRRQTYKNLEVILVDDGSDDPDAIAQLDRLEPEFQQKGWQIIRQENLHAGAARNTCARHARGRYLVFLDDDNCAKEHELETFVRCAETSGADILTCFADTFQSDTFPTDEDVENRVTPLGADESLGLFVNCFGDTNALVRRESFERINGFTEDYAVGREDHEFFARAVLSGLKLMVVPEALYWYRADSQRLSLVNRFRPEGSLRVLRPYLEFTPPELHNVVRLAMAQGAAGQLDSDALTWRLADGLRRSIVKFPGMERFLLWVRSNIEKNVH